MDIENNDNKNHVSTVELDVREDIASGADPFDRIMKSANALKVNESLAIINSFEPFPLYSVMRHKGFSHKTERSDEGFRITFYRTSVPGEEGGNGGVTDENSFNDSDLKNLAHRNIIELDVSGLVPPQPLLKIFETLENMKEDEALKISHDRKPVHLYPRLKDAGYKFVTEETSGGSYEIKIWR